MKHLPLISEALLLLESRLQYRKRGGISSPNYVELRLLEIESSMEIMGGFYNFIPCIHIHLYRKAFAATSVTNVTTMEEVEDFLVKENVIPFWRTGELLEDVAL